MERMQCPAAVFRMDLGATCYRSLSPNVLQNILVSSDVCGTFTNFCCRKAVWTAGCFGEPVISCGFSAIPKRLSGLAWMVSWICVCSGWSYSLYPGDDHSVCYFLPSYWHAWRKRYDFAEFSSDSWKNAICSQKLIRVRWLWRKTLWTIPT